MAATVSEHIKKIPPAVRPIVQAARRGCGAPSGEAAGQEGVQAGRLMCGRISFSFNRAELLATYAWLRDAPDEDARYNIAPTDPVVAVGPHSADVVRWGIDGRQG